MIHHIALLIALALSAPSWALAQQFTSTTADVVAWNFKGFTPISDAQRGELTRVLLDVDAEIVAAVEVNPDNVVHDVAAELTELGTCYDARILAQTASQNIGVIFKCEVQVTNPRLVPNSDDGNSALRKAFAVDVRMGEFDFVMILLHLKSGRSSSDRDTRDRQVAHLASFIAVETAGDERDVLVVGDYNMIPGQDDSNFNAMNPSNFLRFISSEDLTGEFSHLSGSGCDDGNLLDGFAISDNHTGEYIEASLRIYPMQRAVDMTLCEFRDDVSDHLPLIARFRIREDDDGIGAGGGGVRIVAVLPNPSGSDHHAEQVTLRNLGTTDVSLDGWRVADDDGNSFLLSGTIAAGATRVITLDRTAMLNNSGDEVLLLSPNGLEHNVTYDGNAQNGQTITFP